MSNTKAICFETTLGEIGVFEKSYTFSRAIEGEGEVKHIHYGDIHTKLPNVINEASILPTITQQDEFQFVNYGDIIIADASEDYKDLGKAVCYLDQEEKKVISGLHTHRLKVNKSKVVPEYLINLFQTSRYQKFVWKMGTGVSVLGLSKSNLSKYPVTLPNIETQKKIGDFFGKFNKKIQLQQEKINLLKEQKKGYMQKIFKQEIRFKDNDGEEYLEWEVYKLKDFVERINRKNTGNMTNHPLTISAQFGLVDQMEYFNKKVASESLTGYYLLRKGEFAYNKSYSKGYPYGAIKRLDRYEHGALSTLYICFLPNKNVSSDFLVQYFDSPAWYREVSMISVEGARNHGLLNVSVTDFFETNHKLPSLEEQIKISNFLSKLDGKIQLEQQKLEALQQQKKGFMQQMFV